MPAESGFVRPPGNPEDCIFRSTSFFLAMVQKRFRPRRPGGGKHGQSLMRGRPRETIPAPPPSTLHTAAGTRLLYGITSPVEDRRIAAARKEPLLNHPQTPSPSNPVSLHVIPVALPRSGASMKLYCSCGLEGDR